ncbi:hypothetical protein [Kitasatospora sp. NPDC127116]|uniref:hypothetical protein n=1 Tax=Kitasatospora sp. NPDC127116 TaxID=3345367 RepID=UPI00363FEAAD
MPTKFMPFKPGGQSLMLRRVLIGLGALVVAALIAGLIARYAGSGHRAPAPAASASPAAPPRTSASAMPSTPAPSTSAKPTVSPVAAPPHTTDPLAFAQAFATALWSYDTRTTTQSQQLAGLRTWMTGESQYADLDAVAAQVPDPTLWDRMHDNGQWATGQAAEAHLPAAFQSAVAKDPTKLTVAYLYAVTVTGTQSITWNDGGRGAEDRAITIAVQCRPGHDCALASIAPTVYP